MKFEFEECATDQPSMVHLVEKIDMVQDKAVTFGILIPHIDFVIPDEFNNVMTCKMSLFSVLPMVILELKQVLHANSLKLHSGSSFLQLGENDAGCPKDMYFILHVTCILG